MKSKESAKSKKQSVVVKDLKARTNPKGGLSHAAIAGIVVETKTVQPTNSISDQAAGGVLSSY